MPPSTELLTTKLNIPPVRASLVPRPRLTQRLEAGLAGALTLVSAPAGSGKTTLIAEWLAASPVRAAWLSLDEDDNDPVRFLTGLAAALRQAGRGTSAALSLLDGPRPQHISPHTILTTLLNDLAARPGAPERIVIVLDDYHAISATAVYEAVAYLLENRPPALHLVLAGRAEPPIPLARLRANGALTEIRAADLSFTPDEAADFLSRGMGVSLSAEQVAALAQRTEGWAAALQLAALALQRPPEVSSPEWSAAFVAGFAGSHRHVFDYLAEEVLGRQPEPVQAFLRQTALLDRLCAPLCEAVTGQPAGQAMLEMLERANLFLVPLDSERRWYRYHHLFGEALRAQLAQAGPDGEAALHRRASLWFAQAGLAGEAIQHALSARDFERAASLIDPAADRLIRRGELETIRRWVAALPLALTRARPALCLWQAWTLIPQGRLADAEDYACLAEAGLRQARRDTAGATFDQRQLLDTLLGQSLLARCSVAQHRDDLTPATDLARAALALLPAEAVSLRSLALLDLGHIYLRRGQLEAAADVLGEALVTVRGDYHPYIHSQILCKLAEVSLMQLRLHAAFNLSQEAVALAAAQRVEALAAEAWLYLGEIQREWNQLDEAGTSLQRCVSLAEAGADEHTRRRACTVWARVKLAQEDWAGAAALQPRVTDEPAWQAWLWLAGGNRVAAAQLLESQVRRRRPPTVTEDLVRARLRLAEGDAPAALALLKRCRGAVEAAGRHDLAVHVALLQALAYQALAQWPQALRALNRALAVAEPAGCVRMFLDEGAPMADLLARCAATQPPRPFVQNVLALFPGRAAPVPAPAANGHAPLLEPLRAREAEIIRLLAAGRSNPEIAAELSLSVNTVRWYLKQLYHKLDVHNRTQAALRARELNL